MATTTASNEGGGGGVFLRLATALGDLSTEITETLRSLVPESPGSERIDYESSNIAPRGDVRGLHGVQSAKLFQRHQNNDARSTQRAEDG